MYFPQYYSRSPSHNSFPWMSSGWWFPTLYFQFENRAKQQLLFTTKSAVKYHLWKSSWVKSALTVWALRVVFLVASPTSALLGNFCVTVEQELGVRKGIWDTFSSAISTFYMGISRSLMKKKVITWIRSSEQRYTHTYAAHTASHHNYSLRPFTSRLQRYWSSAARTRNQSIQCTVKHHDLLQGSHTQHWILINSTIHSCL